jgi:hypothetical protein
VESTGVEESTELDDIADDDADEGGSGFSESDCEQLVMAIETARRKAGNRIFIREVGEVHEV